MRAIRVWESSLAAVLAVLACDVPQPTLPIEVWILRVAEVRKMLKLSRCEGRAIVYRVLQIIGQSDEVFLSHGIVLVFGILLSVRYAA